VRALRDHDLTRLGERLQSSGQVRRLADDAALLCFTRPDQIADDHQPSGNTDAGLQGYGEFERPNCSNPFQSRAHGPLSIVLVRLRIAEVHEDAVAHVFGDEPIKAAHSVGHAFLIGRDYLPEVFRVHASRQRCRTHQVREHDGDLTALGSVVRCNGSSRHRARLWCAF
jgi:hypothetical protein